MLAFPKSVAPETDDRLTTLIDELLPAVNVTGPEIFGSVSDIDAMEPGERSSKLMKTDAAEALRRPMNPAEAIAQAKKYFRM
jgi:hypothetical protein